MIRERIIQYIESKEISKYQFYKITGFSNGFLDKEGSIGSDKCEQIIYSFPELNPEWLITGKGEMLREKFCVSVSEPDVKVYNSRIKSNNKNTRIPLYNIEAVAGVVEVFNDLKNKTPVAFLDIPNLPPSDAGVFVTGDSMYPLLKSGDIIAYKVLNDIRNVLWGEMYILSIYSNGDHFITIKYIQKSDIDGHIKLVSQNQHHQDKDVPISSIVVAARITASVRLNSMG